MDMDDAFLKKLVDRLAAAGFEAKFTGLCMTVAGCRFAVDYVKRSTKTHGAVLVKFLGSTFKVSPSGSFDIDKAVGLVVKAMPAKLAELRARDNRVKYATMLKEEFRDYPLAPDQTGMRVAAEKITVACTSTGLVLSMVSDDAGKIKRAIAALENLQ